MRSIEAPAGALAVIAEFRAAPGKEDALRELTLPLVAKARSEPATLLFFLHEDNERLGRFVFYELYASEADFEVHRAQPHVQEWFGALRGLTDGDLRVSHMRIIGPR